MSAIDVDKNWQLLINGEWVDPAAGTYDVIDPAAPSWEAALAYLAGI